MIKKRFFLGLAMSLVLSTTAAATGLTNTQIHGNKVTADLDLPGIDAEIILTFDQVVGLTTANLGLSAALLTPIDILALLPRLPATGLSIPAGFPVLITIDPPAGSPISFSNAFTLEIYTHNLPYVAGSQLRLFSAPAGGLFQDVTARNSSGSYRVGADHPGFTRSNSNVVVLDPRLITSVVDIKFVRLDDVRMIEFIP